MTREPFRKPGNPQLQCVLKRSRESIDLASKNTQTKTGLWLQSRCRFGLLLCQLKGVDVDHTIVKISELNGEV